MLENLFRTRLVFWAAMLALFALQIALRSASEMNHDAAWYLYVAQSLAAGKAMYRDIMEVNPPLAAWETLPVAWIAGATGLSMVIVFNTLVFALTALSVALSGRYLALVGQFHPPARRLAMLLGAAALLYFPGGSFGEREHLMAILFLPWLVLRAARAEGGKVVWPEALAIGLMAALGICLKPHALLAPIAAELALLALHRQPRRLFAPENAAAAATTLLYVAAVRVFTPDFFTVMLPLGLRAYVPFIGFDRQSIVIGSLGAIGSLIMAFILVRLSPTGSRALAVAFLAAALGFLLAYFLQGKGFSYQLLPALIFAALAGLAVLPEREWPAKGQALRRSIAVALAALLVAANIHGQSYFYLSDGFDTVIAKTKPGAKSIFVATTNLSLSFPLVTRGGYHWASRFPAQWLTPYLSTVWQSGELPADDIAIEALNWTVTDLTAVRPDVVIVDTSKDQAYVPGGRFDYIGFWSLDPRFAEFWKDYELRDTIMEFAVYVRR